MREGNLICSFFCSPWFLVAPMVPCVAPGFCGSFGSCVPGGSWWLRGFLLLAACLGTWLIRLLWLLRHSLWLLRLLWLFALMAPSAPHLHLHLRLCLYLYLNQSINLSFYLSIYLSICLSIYLTLSYSILPYLTVSFPILPYLILSFPFYSIFPLLRMNVS